LRDDKHESRKEKEVVVVSPGARSRNAGAELRIALVLRW